ncbi:MAG: hypothetical protein N2317_06745 [Syntrophales bacterium]|nr:hypothetical protein [Syntrophales bacterium]
MRPERLYLNDIIEAADVIARFLRGVGEVEFIFYAWAEDFVKEV